MKGYQLTKFIMYMVVVLGVVAAGYHPKEVEAIVGFDVFGNVRLMIREMEDGFAKVMRTLQSY